MNRLAIATTFASMLLAAPAAHAFCGFYVSGGDQQMFNDATQVVLMRMGTRTVLAMQNNYKGPPEAFAMVIPVPVVLHEGDVKTLKPDVFKHVEQMGAPRLVEYWEQDPCGSEPDYERRRSAGGAPPMMPTVALAKSADLGVTIEAKFVVGEYQILILSAKDSTGLSTWLAQEHYKIPDGAEPLLRPYVEQGMKFFVAKVDPQKVKFVDGRAALSPLRFHYDSEDFNLPIRLGLASSSGTQDLIVNILAPHQRYEVTNYPNVTIPTNIDVNDTVKDKFGAFYAALFDRTVEKHPGAVVTEYAWQATTCDPCPGPALNAQEFTTLGADVLDGPKGAPAQYSQNDFVLTRLHARYGKTITDDLRFKQVDPIAGGREHLKAATANNPEQLEEGAQSSSVNNFQGRYAIRHGWTGPVACEAPRRHRWGGPPADVQRQPGFIATGVKPAVDLAFAPRNSVDLPTAVRRDVPEIDLKMAASAVAAPIGGGAAPAPSGGAVPAAGAPASRPKKTGCGCGIGSDSSGLLVGLSVLLVGRRRRRG